MEYVSGAERWAGEHIARVNTGRRLARWFPQQHAYQFTAAAAAGAGVFTGLTGRVKAVGVRIFFFHDAYGECRGLCPV